MKVSRVVFFLIIKVQDPNRHKELRNKRLIRKRNYPNVILYSPIRPFSMIHIPGKQQKQFVHQLAAKLYDLVNTCGIESVKLKTFRELKQILSVRESCENILAAMKCSLATDRA